MSYLKKDIAQLLDAPPSSTSFLCRRLGVEPDCSDGTYSYCGAAALVAACELRDRGLSFALSGAAGRALRAEIGELIADPSRESWIMLDHDGDTPAARIASSAAELIDHVQEDDVILKCRPLAERALASIRDAKRVTREAAN